MRYIIRKKKHTNECDTGSTGSGDSGYSYASEFGFGMGPVKPNGGPDRWDNIITGLQQQTPAPKRRKYKIRKKRK